MRFTQPVCVRAYGPKKSLSLNGVLCEIYIYQMEKVTGEKTVLKSRLAPRIPCSVHLFSFVPGEKDGHRPRPKEDDRRRRRPHAWHPRPKNRPSNEARLQECQKSRKELTPRRPLACNEYAYTDIWAALRREVASRFSEEALLKEVEEYDSKKLATARQCP